MHSSSQEKSVKQSSLIKVPRPPKQLGTWSSMIKRSSKATLPRAALPSTLCNLPGDPFGSELDFCRSQPYTCAWLQPSNESHFGNYGCQAFCQIIKRSVVTSSVPLEQYKSNVQGWRIYFDVFTKGALNSFHFLVQHCYWNMWHCQGKRWKDKKMTK